MKRTILVALAVFGLSCLRAHKALACFIGIEQVCEAQSDTDGDYEECVAAYCGKVQ